MIALIMAVLVAIATATTGGVVAASDAAGPGDPLYAVDQRVEQVRGQMTHGERQVEFLSRVANERLDEAEALYASGDDANFQIALANYNAAVEAMMASVQGDGVDSEQASVLLTDKLDEQAQRLNAILDAPKDGELPDGDSGEESAETDDAVYCTGEEEHPAAVLLADLYSVSYDEVIGYYCDGYTLGEVRLAYDLSLASEVAVADIFAMAADGRSWEDIAATLGVDLDGFGDYNFDDDEITEEERANICTSEEMDPTAERLADLYGVSYDEVLGWFCAGYDFDDIRMAYDIGHMADMPVADVFALREDNDSWDDVLVILGLLPGDDESPDEPTRREAICNGDIHSVTGQAVADRYGVSYGDVLDWYCDGYTFSEVRLAYELADISGESVAAVFALYADTGSWDDVLVELDLTIEDLPASFRDYFSGDTEDDDEDRDDDDDDFDDEIGCTGANPHPVAQRLDAMYDTATYEEIVTWHCEGFGFGEIMHALATGKTADLDPEELLQMKLEMGGWGQVWQSLDLIGKNREQGERHGPPNRVDDDDDNGPADVSPRNDNNGRGNGNGNGDDGNNGRGNDNGNNGNNGNNGRGNGNNKNK